MFLYMFLLALALYNTYFFLYRQKRWKIYFISVFYGFAYIVIIVRLALAVLVVSVSFGERDPERSRVII